MNFEDKNIIGIEFINQQELDPQPENVNEKDINNIANTLIVKQTNYNTTNINSNRIKNNVTTKNNVYTNKIKGDIKKTNENNNINVIEKKMKNEYKMKNENKMKNEKKDNVSL